MSELLEEQPDEVLLAEIDAELDSLENRVRYLEDLKTQIKNRQNEQTRHLLTNL